MGVDVYDLQQISNQVECDHRTQVNQVINNIPMRICCDCSYFKVAIYEKNIFEGKGD